MAFIYRQTSLPYYCRNTNSSYSSRCKRIKASNRALYRPTHWFLDDDDDDYDDGNIYYDEVDENKHGRQ